MPVEIVPTEPVRYRFMREVIRYMISRYPRQMREASEGMKQTVGAQIDPKTGRWKTDAGGSHFSVSFPQIFMDVLRPLMRKFLPDEEPFAQDDSDLIWLFREFPDLVGGPGVKAKAAEPKKDPRPRTRIK